MNSKSYPRFPINSPDSKLNCEIHKNKAIKKKRGSLKVYHPTNDQQRRELLHKVIDGHMTIHDVKHINLTH